MDKFLKSVVFFVLLLQMEYFAHAQFLQTITHLDKYNSLTINEQLYIHTNCEVYAPGDTIWFNAYVRNKASLKKTTLSNVLFLLLLDDQGNVIQNEKTIITDSYSNGFLVLSHDIKEQNYWLVGYSSWMKNFQETEVFKKKIRIEKEFKNDNSYSLMFNKDYYQPGDTLKAIVTCYEGGKKVTKNSQFRYKLLGDNNTLEKGTANTLETEDRPLSIILPDSAAENFVLRLWDKDISTDFMVPYYSQIDVHFFPEGGNCLVNEPGIVAFKAVSTLGIPVEISGIVVDEKGQEYANVKTDYMGMGKFIFAPQKEMNYYLLITNPKGYRKKYRLPAAKENFWAIEAQSLKDNIYVEVKNNALKFDTCLLTLTIRGYSFYYKLITSGAQATFTIPTEKLPAGIGVLTLLNGNNLPLSERLVFINHDRFVDSGISTVDSQYLSRDLVTIKIRLENENTDFSAGHYSLSVYDAMFGASKWIDEPNIISSNYLVPEIKGVIYNPNYYFESKNKLVEYHLDLLLLTQGWRNYSYLKSIAAIDSIKTPINQEIVSGTLLKKRFNGDEIPTEGEILIYFSGESKRIVTDKKGKFSFYPEYTANNTSSILLSAPNKGNSDEFLIKLENDGFQDSLRKNLVLTNDSNTFQKTLTFTKLDTAKNEYSFFATNNNIWIEEVKINANRTLTYEEEEAERIKDSYTNAKSPAPDLLKSSIDIESVVNGMGFYCYVTVGDELYLLHRGMAKPVKFIVDGMDKGFFYSNVNLGFNPAFIKEFIVITGWEAAMYGDSNPENKGFSGDQAVLYMVTDKEAYKKYHPVTDNTPNSISIDGIQVIKEFYSPTYLTQEEKENPVPDLRKTIYWNPNVVLDSNGYAEISFYNPDHYTKVNCVIEGITESGIPVYSETDYTISDVRK
ncbi:MAG: hypothetical protein WCX31_05220 [Salinivirgaceae bacterium]